MDVSLSDRKLPPRDYKKAGLLKNSDSGVEKERNLRVILLNVTIDGMFLKYASQEYRNNREIVLAAVSNNGKALKYASYALRDDLQVVRQAVSKYGKALKYASKRMQGYSDIVLPAISNDWRALCFASDTLKSVYNEMYNSFFEHGFVLDNARPSIQACPAMIIAALKTNVDAMQYASTELLQNPEFVLAAVKTNGMALRHAFSELQSNPRICMAAVKNNFRALCWFKQNSKLVLAAMKIDGRALEYASKEFKSDIDIVAAAVSNHDGVAVSHAEEECFSHPKVMSALLTKPNLDSDEKLLQYIKGPYLDQILLAIRRCVREEKMTLAFSTNGSGEMRIVSYDADHYKSLASSLQEQKKASKCAKKQLKAYSGAMAAIWKHEIGTFLSVEEELLDIQEFLAISQVLEVLVGRDLSRVKITRAFVATFAQGEVSDDLSASTTGPATPE